MAVLVTGVVAGLVVVIVALLVALLLLVLWVTRIRDPSSTGLAPGILPGIILWTPPQPLSAQPQTEQQAATPGIVYYRGSTAGIVHPKLTLEL